MANNRKRHDFKNPEKRTRTLNFDNKILKIKKLDGSVTLKVSQNQVSGRIFVEFASGNGTLTLQKSFQNTFEGTQESDAFQNSIKSLKDLRKYFGLEKQ